MATNPSSADVQSILGRDYTTGRDLTPFVNAAAMVVARAVTCASGRGVTLTSDEQTAMIAWTAAYYYTRSDRTYKSRSTLSASGAWNTDGNEYRDGAIALDPSGCLGGLLKAQRAGFAWTGRTVPEQTDYWDRNGG